MLILLIILTITSFAIIALLLHQLKTRSTSANGSVGELQSLQQQTEEKLETLLRQSDEKLKLIIEAEIPKVTGGEIGKLTDASKGLHEQQIESLNKEISSLLNPTKEEFAKLQKQITELRGAYQTHAGTSNEIRKAVTGLQDSTDKFTQIMNSAPSRGQWGEFELEKLVESAGLTKDYSYRTQVTVEGLRPDMIIELPGGGRILIDSKFPATEYLLYKKEIDDEKKSKHLSAHVKAIEHHAKDLKSKHYPDKVNKQKDGFISPDFVVMFLPIESMYLDALGHTGDLLQKTTDNRIILTSPLSLLGFLLVVAKGWQQLGLERNIAQIQQTAAGLYNDLLPFLGHLDKLGGSIKKVVELHSALIGSVVTTTMPKLKRLEALGMPKDERTDINPIEIPEVRDVEEKYLLSDSANEELS